MNGDGTTCTSPVPRCQPAHRATTGTAGAIRRSVARAAPLPKSKAEVERPHLAESRLDVGPVHDLPVRLHPGLLVVAILEVVGVLPHVEHQQGHGAVADVALVVIDLLDDERAPQ